METLGRFYRTTAEELEGIFRSCTQRGSKRYPYFVHGKILENALILLRVVADGVGVFETTEECHQSTEESWNERERRVYTIKLWDHVFEWRGPYIDLGKKTRRYSYYYIEMEINEEVYRVWFSEEEYEAHQR